MKKLNITFIFIYLSILTGICSSIPSTQRRNKLLYILIDAFRYDYVDSQPAKNLPGFTRLLSEGSRAAWLDPIFPSVSFPDWTSLVTGMWAESHGLVGNYIYDPVAKDNFSLFDAETTGMKKWWTTEPIWTTAEKAGLETAVILWSRCDIPYDEIVPEFCQPFVDVKGHDSFRNNLVLAVDKLQNGADLAMVYTSHIDTIGHNSGPDSEDMKREVRNIDAIFDYLLTRIDELGLTDEVNIVVVSDHGMRDTAPGNINRIEIDDYLLTDLVEKMVDSGALSNIKVKPDDPNKDPMEMSNVDKVYNKLMEMPGVEVYKHADIPEYFHYKNHKYIHDILVKANNDSFILPSSNDEIMLPRRNHDYVYMGHHGWYSREVPQLRGIFFAKGPDFQSNVTIGSIEIVDVYSLLTNVLDIPQNANNGSFNRIKGVLKLTDQRDSSDGSNDGLMGKASQFQAFGYWILTLAFASLLL